MATRLNVSIDLPTQLLINEVKSRIRAVAKTELDWPIAALPTLGDALDAICDHANPDAIVTAWRDRQLTRETADVG